MYWFDQYYSPVTHAEYFIINIPIVDMHRLTIRILDVSIEFQNMNVPIHERVCVSPPSNYLYRFEKSYPNVTLTRDNGPFPLQCINGIQETKPARQQWSRLIDAVVTILKYNKSTIDHAIYIKVFCFY